MLLLHARRALLEEHSKLTCLLPTQCTHTGKQAVYSLSSGHRIAAFGGAYDVDHFTSDEMANATQPLSTRHFTASSTEAFKNKLSPPRPEHTSALAAASAAPPPPIDILITNEWPTEITHLASKEPPGFSADWGVPAISSVLSLAQPKYHFVSNSEHPSFWEREPFRWPAASSSTKHATRFISLAQMGNKDKARWFYAFSLPPLEAPPAPVPANTTSCPLDHALQGAEAVGHRGKKRPFGVDESENTVPDYIFGGVAGGKPERKKQPPKDYVCRICNQPGHFIQDCEQAGQSQPKKPRAPPKEILRSCFCVSFAVSVCAGFLIRLNGFVSPLQRASAGSACPTLKSRSTSSPPLVRSAT